MTYNTPIVHGHVDYHFPEKLSFEHAQNGRKIMMVDGEFGFLFNLFHNVKKVTLGMDIFANRLFGPLPRTSTYLCIWEIKVGRAKLDMSLADAQLLALVGQSFGLGFADLANAPAAEHMPLVDPDSKNLQTLSGVVTAHSFVVTFYKVNVKSVEITLRADSAALGIICKSGIKIDSNDVGGLNYGRSTGLRIPDINVKALLNASTERNTWLEAADIATDLYVDIYASPKGFKQHIEKQRAFVSEQDKVTGRMAKLLGRMQRGQASSFFI